MATFKIDMQQDCYSVFDRAGEGVMLHCTFECSHASGSVQASLVNAVFGANDKKYLAHIGADEAVWTERALAALYEAVLDDPEGVLDAKGAAQLSKACSGLGVGEEELFESIAALA